jgi:hypothetical protein
MSRTEESPAIFQKPVLRDAFFWLFLATTLFWAVVIYLLFF